MKLWIDENIPRLIDNALRQAGCECFSAPRKTGDPIILQHALEARAVIITHDHDFEHYVLKQKRPCNGVILIQAVAPNRLEELTVRLVRLIETRKDILTSSFIFLSLHHQTKIVKLR